MAKVYAVRKGEKVGIFNTWKECEEVVKGFSGAEFKSFTNINEAKEYMGFGVKVSLEREINEEKVVKAYVDGSYNVETKKFGSGIVLLFKDKKETFSIIGEEESLCEMRNVAGEIKGAEFAINYAIKENAEKVEIYYDYEGIEKWCNGAWKTNKEGTIRYKEFYNKVKDLIDIKFIKVKAHSGDKYNEEADILAKKSVGII
ncbi:MAG: viroplasmin family protein [Clostridiaceae bacterium]